MSSIRQMLEEREQYIASMKLYHEKFSELQTLLEKKELELKRIFGESDANQIIASITSGLEEKELSIPMKSIPDMNDSDRRYLIIGIAKNNLLINELNQKLIDLIQ